MRLSALAAERGRRFLFESAVMDGVHGLASRKEDTLPLYPLYTFAPKIKKPDCSLKLLIESGKGEGGREGHSFIRPPRVRSADNASCI